MRPRACITTVVLVTAILLGETVVAQMSHQQTANTSNAAAALHPLTKPAVSASSSITAPIQFIKVDGLNIAYKVIGQGKPIIFLARFRGTLNDWDPAFVDAVAKSYRVILFDAPGVGRSTGVVSTSVTKWADQAVQFTHALGIEQAMYLGWSMGGAAAQIIAINHPDSVDKLLLLATGPPGNPDFDPANPEFGSRARKPVYEFDDYQFLFFYKSETAKAACASCLKRVNLIQDKDVAVTPEGYNNMTAAKSVGSSSTGTTSKRPPPNPALAGIE